MLTPASMSTLSSGSPAKLPANLDRNAAQGETPVAQARELKQAFGQFVGETFLGQMLKTMRSSVGEPAYFHGGMAEEQFQARLDQQMSQDMAASGGSAFAEGLFEQQFPTEAALLKADERAAQPGNGLEQLNGLRRR